MKVTKSVAIDTARKALSVGPKAEIGDAQMMVSPGQMLPFLEKPTPVWKVRCDNVNIKVTENAKAQSNPHIRSIDVYVSSETGQIVKIESIWPKGVAGTRFPSVKRQEEQMARVSQRFIGLPDKSPTISFRQALEKTDGAGQAKQIIAYYVRETYTDPKVTPRSVWVIHAWGIPPFLPKGGDVSQVPEDARNHLRSIINAQTGEWYGADSIPQPD